VKKVHHRSSPYNKCWPPLGKRLKRSVTAYGPSFRSECFELHQLLRAVRKGSAPAKFIAALTTLSQSFAPLDASWWTLHKLWWGGCKRITNGHGIAGTVSGVEAAIYCGKELRFLNFPVLSFCIYDNVYHRQKVCFGLYLLGQIVTPN